MIKSIRFTYYRLPLIAAVALASLLIVARGWDLLIFRHAAALLMQGQSPYLEHGFNNPPWALLAILPTIYLPREITLLFIAALSLIVIFRLLKDATKFQIAVVLLSPWAILSAAYINLDWLVMGGAFLPPALGVWLLALKPQATGGLLLLWLWQAWRNRWTLRMIEKVSYIALIIAFGLYLLLVPHANPFTNFSASIFPLGLPFGAWLLYHAFMQRDDRSALSAAPLLSPYVGFGSWAMLLPWLLTRSKWLLAGVVLAGWAVAIAGLWV